MKILVIQLKRIGDLVLTAPMIAALREHFPTAKIHLAIESANRALAPALPGVDRVLIAKGGWREAGDWVALATEGYDWCIDLTRTDRSAALTFLSRAKRKITFERTLAKSKWRPFFYDEIIDSSVRYNHTVDHHLAFLAPLGIHDANPAIKLHVPAAAQREAEKTLAQAKVVHDFVIFHPGSARAEKFWEATQWAEIIDCAQNRGLDCILTGGTAPIEQTHLAAIQSKLRRPAIDLAGKIDLLTLTALIAKARLLVTVDSAPTHLAAAMQTPQVCLYGPTNPFHWRPRCAPAVIIQAGSPAPLTEFSPHQRGAAMNEISTAQVIDAMETLLSAPAATLS